MQWEERVNGREINIPKSASSRQERLVETRESNHNYEVENTRLRRLNEGITPYFRESSQSESKREIRRYTTIFAPQPSAPSSAYLHSRKQASTISRTGVA